MALIEKFFLFADHYPVNASASIIEGQIVKLNSSGECILATGAANEVAIGVAADTKSSSASGLPSTNDARIGSNGNSTSAFVNRVNDTFDETKASGRMTVYHTGGTFATNQYETGDTFAVNSALYVSANGKLSSSVSTAAQIIGYCTKVPGAYASGVPGVDINSDLSLGNYLEFKLVA